MKKITKILITISSIFILSTSFVYAQGNKITGGQSGPPIGEEYVVTTQTKYLDTTYSQRSYNNAPTVNSLRVTMSRTKYSNFTVNTSAEITIMTGKAGMATESKNGDQEVVTVEKTWNIPANSVYQLEFGSMAVRQVGKFNKWQGRELISSRTVYGDWTYTAYDKMTKVN